tara:strand:+ start:16270 stop:16548 length:279 start_codon:yes stop_codon:yes gene_type:complete
MNKIGEIVAHFSKKNDIINFGVIVNQEKREETDWIKVKWTNREFSPDDDILSEELWISKGDVEIVEPFGLISDLHLAMIEQAKVHFVRNERQ